MLDLVHSQVYQSAQSNLHNVKQDQQVPIFYHNLQLLSSMVYHLDKNIQKLRSDAQQHMVESTKRGNLHTSITEDIMNLQQQEMYNVYQFLHHLKYKLTVNINIQPRKDLVILNDREVGTHTSSKPLHHKDFFFKLFTIFF